MLKGQFINQIVKMPRWEAEHVPFFVPVNIGGIIFVKVFYGIKMLILLPVK